MRDDLDAADPIDLNSRRRAAGSMEPMFTIKDVGDACGLPQPVVAQVVPRTWTDEGWMYTAGQLQYAVQIAPRVRAGADVERVWE